MAFRPSDNDCVTCYSTAIPEKLPVSSTIFCSLNLALIEHCGQGSTNLTHVVREPTLSKSGNDVGSRLLLHEKFLFLELEDSIATTLPRRGPLRRTLFPFRFAYFPRIAIIVCRILFAIYRRLLYANACTEMGAINQGREFLVKRRNKLSVTLDFNNSMRGINSDFAGHRSPPLIHTTGQNVVTTQYSSRGQRKAKSIDFNPGPPPRYTIPARLRCRRGSSLPYLFLPPRR